MEVLNWLIFTLREGRGKFISANDHGAKCTKERRSGFVVFTKSKLKKTVKYIKIATLNLGIGNLRKLLEFQWVWNLYHFLLICFYIIMKSDGFVN